MTDVPTPRRSTGGRQYDAAQLRLDSWNDLHIHGTWLREFTRNERDPSEPRAALAADLETLRCLERYFSFPGREAVRDFERDLAESRVDALARRADRLARLLVGEGWRQRTPAALDRVLADEDHDHEHAEEHDAGDAEERLRFDMLVVDDLDADERRALRESFRGVRSDDDEFLYDLVTVPSFEDAVIAVLVNRTIQSCVLRYDFTFHTEQRHAMLDRYLEQLAHERVERCYGFQRSLALGRVLKALRPELDLFLVTDTPLEEVAGHTGRHFRRVFYRLDNYLELHLSILKGVRTRYEAPFFDALRRFSQRPAGVFHALPISRGKSITNGHWIRDMGRFYGTKIFLAETSATSGGLDSLLQPHGPIKRAQDAAARAFGAKRTFFVTNGTSTANKIVTQALVRPGDIVLLSHDCHKSHPYALMLADARPVYLDAYPLTPYSMYGAVPLAEIKGKLLALKRAGKLDRVRLLLLTNCTFDGVTYDPYRVMREVLAIKPDMIFLWDEAWFAFAGFHPQLRRRTAMHAAARLHHELHSEEYRARYDAWRAETGELDPDDEAAWDGPLLPDPDRAVVRVYATQSTHKTLTALRQGSMIHHWDERFEQQSADAFREAFMTHTSTSPNYQILASLDVGRRQVELEGNELVHKSVGLAMVLRKRIAEHPRISRWFRVLRPGDVIPAEHRPSGLEFYYDAQEGWARMEEAWRTDEFTLDPTRVTLHVGATGIDGDSFRHLLMDEHDIQINKTSRNSVLFMTNIGMSRGDIAYLVEVLAKIAADLDERLADANEMDRRLHDDKARSLTEDLPPLPYFSRFHDRFRDGDTPEGRMREAFFLAYDDANCEYLKLDGSITAALDAGREVVSAGYVTPYPPGFPILVPGQVISRDILRYLNAVDVKEIHGYKPAYGLRVFTEAVLAASAPPGPAHEIVAGEIR